MQSILAVQTHTATRQRYSTTVSSSGLDTRVEVIDTGCGSDGLGRLHFEGPHKLVPCLGLIPSEECGWKVDCWSHSQTPFPWLETGNETGCTVKQLTTDMQHFNVGRVTCL